MIVATMATLASREVTLVTTVASLIDHVDCLIVYCNGHERVPKFLLHPKIAHVVLSREHGIRGAEAKLLPWDRDVIQDGKIVVRPDYEVALRQAGLMAAPPASGRPSEATRARP